MTFNAQVATGQGSPSRMAGTDFLPVRRSPGSDLSAEQAQLEDEAFDFVECQARIARQLAAAADREVFERQFQAACDDPRGFADGLGA